MQQFLDEKFRKHYTIYYGYRNDDIRHPSPRLSGFNFANLTFQLVEIGKNRVKTT